MSDLILFIGFYVLFFIYAGCYLFIKKIRPIIKWYDIWVGIFIDTKKKIIYIFPVPMIGIKIELL